MSTAPRPLDILTFPFEGAQVIEASAGTGKTWTLATLYLRLVLGEGPGGRPLLPPQILVMTFTEAATQELRERIRSRLAEAAAFFRGQPAPASDPMLHALRKGRPEASWPADVRLLEAAGQWMDEAAIHTIHGWCSRMLRQHAFDSGSLFEQQRVEDPEALLAGAVRDYWRHWVYAADPAALRALPRFPASPDALLAQLRPRLAQFDRAPGAGLEEPLAEPPAFFATALAAAQARDAATQRARGLWRDHQAVLEAQLQAAMATSLHGGVYKLPYRASYLQRMRDWCDGGTLPRADLERFGARKLAKSTKAKHQPPADDVGAFAALDALLDCADPPDLAPLFAHAAREVRARVARRKQQLAQFDYPDLLQRLHQALHAPDGHLARAIRRQYPVALVDEFQDTDRWQYGALARIYLTPSAVQAGPAALVMIGDPKQAIYRFRGADLDTYLEARAAAQAIHTLTGNFRSTPGLVSAVNQVFGSAHEPFGQIRYEPVTARRRDVRPLQGSDGRALPAMTVWHADAATPLNAGALADTMAEGFATQIVALLDAGVARAAEIAVLVRNVVEARRIRAALQARGVRSVYLSDRDSVWATAEARDLWYILRAVATPRSAGAMRAALSTRCFGYGTDELEQLFADEPRLEQEAENFARWQQVWQRQGLLAMLHALLHEQQIPARLRWQADGTPRPDGERRLTNLLHLGDLLQQASLGLQGEVAVVRHLAGRLHARAGGEDAAQMRLETDAELVQVVTLHKSKGLQYPVVFLPFAYDFRAARGADAEPDAQRIPEDIRLLYVGFTRAERALFVGAATRQDDLAEDRPPRSALAHLLGRQSPEDLDARLAAWAQCPDIHVAVLPPADLQPCTVGAAPVTLRPALQPRRRHAGHWRSTSFSALTRELGTDAAPRLPATEADERYDDAQVDNPLPAAAPGPADFDAFPAGARYGDLLHGLLEWQVKAGWPLLAPEDGTAHEAWQALLSRHAAALGLDLAQRDRLERWVAAIGRCPLPLAAAPVVTLGGLRADQRWAEMGFVITTHGVAATTVDALVTRHLLAGRARDPLAPDQLEGLLTGFLDLVFEQGGRWYVLDYKSNRLADYAPATLEAAILAHRYDLQYALYLLALHRLLRARLPGYDYDSHLGGAIYLFARGIGSPGNGIYLDRPGRVLIDALDAAFREVPP